MTTAMITTMTDRCDRLDRMIAEKRIIRGEWRGVDAMGRETACLLAALVPECGTEECPSACPDDVMPTWLAALVPAMNDQVSEAEWLTMIRRFAALARRWHVLNDTKWKRLGYAARIIALDEADRHYNHERYPAIAQAIEAVRGLSRRAIDGKFITEKEWDDVAFKVRHARETLNMTIAATRAAGLVLNVFTTRFSIDAIGDAFDIASGAASASDIDRSASSSKAWDRMTQAVFNAIEDAIKAVDASVLR